ncbi:MAG: DUF3579 domain-containing protein [Gammaproteobacteria bacterium]|nr:DUF3579 domain-containing protein [Gammaproteobacteria bacterium]
MSDNHQNKCLTIIGVSPDGKEFRPSDWADRLCGSLATLRGNRVQFDDRLRPITLEGKRCILLDTSLENEYPALYKDIMEFATKNKLEVCEAMCSLR